MLVCNRCGHKTRDGARYCSYCGLMLPVLAERKHVTVFFADMVESTPGIASVDCETAQGSMDLALALMVRAVEEFGGWVYQIRGDEIVALFGAPKAIEAHALRACLAALALHTRARGIAATSEQAPRFRIGIDSGEVLLGSVGEFRTAQPRVDGVPMNRTKRLEELAPRGSTLIGEAAWRLLEERLDTVRFGDVVLAGFESAGPYRVHELMGAVRRNVVAPLTRQHHLVESLLGRGRELAAIRDQAQRARLAGCRFIGLRGEPGIGKTRLALEATLELGRQDFVSVWATARTYARRMPYGAAAEFARALLGLSDDFDLDGQQVAAREAIERLDAALAAHRDALYDLMGIGTSGDAWAALTPNLRRRKLVDAIQACVCIRARNTPLLFVIDDLSFADDDSLRLLEVLMRRLKSVRVLVCASYRPEFTYRWSDTSWCQELWIGPLPAEDTEAMAAELLGHDESVQGLGLLLSHRSGGNPFFLEQIVMELVDQKVLVGAPGVYRRVCETTSLRTPSSIADVIAARVDSLPSEVKAILECAAVLSDPITPRLLARMQKSGDAATQAQLQRARSAGLMVVTSDAGTRYQFRHGLVQELVTSRLPGRRRRELHCAAFAALDQDPEGMKNPAMLTQHAYDGEAWDEVSTWALRAMARAIGMSAFRDALRFFAQGLTAIGHLQTRSDVEQRTLLVRALELRKEALGAQIPLGKMSDAVENLERARDAARGLDDRRGLTGVDLQLAVIHWTLGNYERGLDAALQAEASAREFAGRSAQMAARQARMLLLHGQGRYPEAVAESRAMLREFSAELNMKRILPRWPVVASVNLHAFAAHSYAAIGDMDSADTECATAWKELEDVDHPFSRVFLKFVQGDIWVQQERYQAAVEMFESALQECREHDIPTMEPPVLAQLCIAIALHGDAATALARIEAAIASRLDSLGGRYNAYYFPASHATALFVAGRAADALEAAQSAQQEAARFGQRGHEAQAQMMLGRIAASLDDRQFARDSFLRAAELAAACGMKALQAKTLHASHAAEPALRRWPDAPSNRTQGA